MLGLGVAVCACASLTPERRYPVFFTPGSATLSPEASSIVQEVATRAQNSRPRQLLVEGHANGAGPAAAALAAARDTAVEAALRADGVDPALITLRTGDPNGPGVVGRDVEIQVSE
jgi:outer membrane protein OmpA-like peptidoglycan-associated protein